MNPMENKEYRAWFENTRESNFKTIGQTETIFEGLVLKIASGAMAISFSFITALAPKIEYRCMWILAVGWGALAACIIWNILHWTVSVLLRHIAFNKSRNPAILAG